MMMGAGIFVAAGTFVCLLTSCDAPDFGVAVRRRGAVTCEYLRMLAAETGGLCCGFNGWCLQGSPDIECHCFQVLLLSE